MKKYDVAIIGAGPAGIASAISLAQQGLKIALLEKNAGPQGKACGEGILPLGVKQIEALGILDLIPTKQRAIIKGINYNLGKINAQAYFLQGSGLGINRLTLSNAFFNKIKNYSNIELLTQHKFISLDGSTLVFKEKEKIGKLKANFIIGADGLRSTVKNYIETKEKESKWQRYALSAHFSIKPWSNMVEIFLKDKAEAYVTPTGPEEINLVLMWHKNKIDKSFKGEALFWHILEQFEELAPYFCPSKLKHPPFATGPFHSRPTKIFEMPNIALAGDAAGYIDPLSGEGINIGLFSGRLLGQIAGSALKEKRLPLFNEFKRYQNELHRYSLGHTILTYGLLNAQKSPWFFSKALAYFKLRPWALSFLTGLSMGLKPRDIALELLKQKMPKPFIKEHENASFIR